MKKKLSTNNESDLMSKNIWLFLALLCSCQNQKQDSKTDFSIEPPSNVLETMNYDISSMIEMLKQGIEVKVLKSGIKRSDQGGFFVNTNGARVNLEDNVDNIDHIHVCFGNGNEGYSTKNLMVEYQIALASWMHASDNFSSMDWDFFKFSVDSKCQENANKYQIAVYIAKDSLSILGREIYHKATIRLNYSARRRGFSLQELVDGTTVGLANKAAGPYIRNSGNEWDWNYVLIENASNLSLNPFRELIPLSEDLSTRNDLKPEDKLKLIKKYNEFLEQDKARYKELVEFYEKLNPLKLQTVNFNTALYNEFLENTYNDQEEKDIIDHTAKLMSLVKQSNKLTNQQKGHIEFNYKRFFGANQKLEVPGVDLVFRLVKQAFGGEIPAEINQQMEVTLDSIDKTQIHNSKLVVYNTILHEIGHQFGIDHAHEINEQNISGNAEKIISVPGDDVEAYISDNSVMSYTGDPIFLTPEDDIPGIKLKSRLMEEFINRRVKKVPEPVDVLSPN